MSTRQFTRMPSTPREHAIFLIAACDHAGAGAYEKHVVAVARKWLRMLDSPRTTQVAVDRMLDEFVEPIPDYGMHWDTLSREITRWASRAGWIEPDDPRYEV